MTFTIVYRIWGQWIRISWCFYHTKFKPKVSFSALYSCYAVNLIKGLKQLKKLYQENPLSTENLQFVKMLFKWECIRYYYVIIIIDIIYNNRGTISGIETGSKQFQENKTCFCLYELSNWVKRLVNSDMFPAISHDLQLLITVL